jgi:hypothetical protein
MLLWVVRARGMGMGMDMEGINGKAEDESTTVDIKGRNDTNDDD